MASHVVHHSGSWTLSERTLLLSLASVLVAIAMALATAGAIWYASVAVFAVTGLWAGARITASELKL